MSKKFTLLFGALVLLSLVLTACGGTADPEIIIQTVMVDGEIVYVEVPAEDTGEEPVAAGGECCDIYRIGIFEDPLTLNYWSYTGPDNSVWTQYALSGQAASLYSLSDQRLDFVPVLATGLPPAPVEEGDFFTITVEMAPDALWSDGVPITANDVAFTVNTSLNLQLGGNWAGIYPSDLIDHVEAIDDTTVKFFFLESPGLAKWQFGAAQGPILPEHYWGPIVAEASAFIEGVELGENPGEDGSEEDIAAYEAAAEAYTNARATLYAFEVDAVPTFGGMVTDSLEPGAFVARTANPNYFLAGAQITEYDDGTWVMTMANGTTYQLYGDATGEKILDFTSGPYSPNTLLSIYGSQDAAFLALANGEVDYVLNPLSLARGLQEQAERGEGIQTYTNLDNGLFYLAFNLRKDPYSFPEFRAAVDWVVDKEFVAGSILQGSVIPTYSVVPSGNIFWYNPNVSAPQIGVSRAERIETAKSLLLDAGWTWTTEPVWNEDDQKVDGGEGLLMPNGAPMPDTTILGPGPAYDPQRASFNQWISEWMRQLGMPVESELTGFNTILNPVFVDSDFDMYILGWGLTLYPDYLCDFFHSKNDTATTGNYNTPGFNDANFDATCDTFLLETDIEAAQVQAFELQDLLGAGRPYIPLFNRLSTDLIRSNVILPYSETLGGLSEVVGFMTDAQVLTSK
jgi:ABC-type transport system substrate-binding protein